MKKGRPTKYDPSVIDKVNEYLATAIPENMDIPTIEGIALLLDVNRDTLYTWAKEHEDFSDTLEKCRVLQKQHLIKTGIFAGKEVNSNIIMLMLKVNHDMIETTRKEITGRDGESLETLVIVRDGNKT